MEDEIQQQKYMNYFDIIGKKFRFKYVTKYFLFTTQN
jgi:hypothetical protein